MDQSKKDSNQDLNPEPKDIEDIQAYQRKWDDLIKDTDRQIKQIRGMYRTIYLSYAEWRSDR